MVDDHLDGQSIVDIHEESVDGIVALGLNGGCVHSGNGSQEGSIVGIFAASTMTLDHVTYKPLLALIASDTLSHYFFTHISHQCRHTTWYFLDHIL